MEQTFLYSKKLIYRSLSYASYKQNRQLQTNSYTKAQYQIIITDLQSVKLVLKLSLVVYEFLMEFLFILLHLVLSDVNLVKDLTRPSQCVPPEERNNKHISIVKVATRK